MTAQPCPPAEMLNPPGPARSRADRLQFGDQRRPDAEPVEQADGRVDQIAADQAFAP
ncbi:hypothetical protein [Nocardia sp. NPDC057455]|uniref:hypothetical protein n=1 Tax=Nocardia sp. NPDC057455 TaxID=3346138 RepID=UPI00366C5F08